MLSFFFKKGVIFLISIWGVINLTFFLVHAIPGDPFIGELEIPEETASSLFSHYELDQPLGVQYFTYLKNVFSCNFGPSIAYPGKSVISLSREGFYISALLGL